MTQEQIEQHLLWLEDDMRDNPDKYLIKSYKLENGKYVQITSVKALSDAVRVPKIAPTIRKTSK